MPPRLSLLFVWAALLSAPTACSRQAALPPPPIPSPAHQLDQQLDPQLDEPTNAHEHRRAAESPGPGSDSDSQLRALELAIETDRLRLIGLITEREGKKTALRDDPELVEIAERLPRLEKELRRLMQQRKASETREASGR